MGVFILGMVFIWFYLSETWSVALASAASVTCASGMGAMWWCTVRARQAEQVLDLIARSGVFLIVQKSEPVAVSLRQMKKLLAKDGVQAVSWLNLLFVPAVHREHANGLVRRAQVYGWAVLDKEALR
ncbi:hypothetical protein KJ608_01060 [Patescibacteria group bacterium]|nr:hypothetical protein [Patescibacteria group bacterium]